MSESIGCDIRRARVAYTESNPGAPNAWRVPWEKLGKREREIETHIGEKLSGLAALIPLYEEPVPAMWHSGAMTALLVYSFGNPAPITLGEQAARVTALANRNGFRDNIPEPKSISAVAIYCANLHGEVSELWEAARNGHLDALCDKSDKMVAVGLEPLTCAEEELADILIRVLDTAGTLGVDIEKAVRVKHAFNETRDFRHGGKLV